MGGSNAVLVTTPRGAHLLIDGGRFPSRLLTAIGDRLPFNDRTLEVLFLTQPDEAQFGALPTLLDRYEASVVLTNGQPNLNPVYTGLLDTLSARPVLNVTTGYTLDTDDGVRITVLNPPVPPALGDSLDATALVLRLTYGEVSFLLTSDLSAEGQQALLESGQDLRAAVLQVPHQLDADFLAAVQPHIAVTQVEAPDEDDMMALDAIMLYRTESEGTIHLSSDGTQLWVGRDSFQ
jgi:competence protein ComEC